MLRTNMWARITSIVGTLCIIDVYRRVQKRVSYNTLLRRKLLARTIRSCSAVLWPCMLLSLVPERDNLTLLIPVVWMLFAWEVDALLMQTQSSPNPRTVPSGIRFETSTVTAMSFGLCGLVGARSDSKYTNLVLYAVMGCVLGVFPSHNVNPDSDVAYVFDEVQKTTLLWCIGLMITGIVLTHTSESTVVST